MIVINVNDNKMVDLFIHLIILVPLDDEYISKIPTALGVSIGQEVLIIKNVLPDLLIIRKRQLIGQTSFYLYINTIRIFIIICRFSLTFEYLLFKLKSKGPCSSKVFLVTAKFGFSKCRITTKIFKIFDLLESSL